MNLINGLKGTVRSYSKFFKMLYLIQEVGMTTGQMNVRIDEQLRIDGTAAFENIGFSPSRIIRALWSFAAKNKNNPVKLERTLAFLNESSSSDDELQRKLRLAAEGSDMLGKGASRLGLSTASTKDLSFKELKELSHQEHWKEKGLL